MFSAGLTALLLQSLHPLAMAGVADHSDYRGDPWGRLQRTSAFIATTFGTIATRPTSSAPSTMCTGPWWVSITAAGRTTPAFRTS